MANQSPSPPPSAPTQTATVSGPRATTLDKIFTSALKSTLKSNSYSNFASCFPTPAKYCPSALEGVWRQLNTRLEEECLKDFHKILEERKVIDGLNAWDEIIIEAQRRRDRAVDAENQGEKPLHLLSAEELNLAFAEQYLVTAKHDLQHNLTIAQDENEKLTAALLSQREEISNLMSGLEHLVSDVNGVVRVLEDQLPDGGEELRREAFEINKEIRSGS